MLLSRARWCNVNHCIRCGRETGVQYSGIYCRECSRLCHEEDDPRTINGYGPAWYANAGAGDDTVGPLATAYRQYHGRCYRDDT